jgi:hypothetical protein
MLDRNNIVMILVSKNHLTLLKE